MSIIATIVSNDDDAMQRYRRLLSSVLPTLKPHHGDELSSIQVAPDGHSLTAVYGEGELVGLRERSAMSGMLLSESAESNWHLPGGPVPDGSFVLFRAVNDRFEFVTDYAGSRPIWHAPLPCGGIVASTCFELIIMLLGDVQLDDEALGWFLSTGNCGPGRSWDRRVKPLTRNSRLMVTNTGSEISVREESAGEMEVPDEAPDDITVAEMLDRSLGRFVTDRHGWLLALSGGCDSRALLHGVREMNDVECVTWADGRRQDAAQGDVDVARRLAEASGRAHHVVEIRRPETAAEFDVAMRRFVRYGDGRTDDFLAYLDGMQMWEALERTRGKALLRGDEVFGSTVTRNSAQVMRNMRLSTFSDYAPHPLQRELADRYPHQLPDNLARRPGETIGRWRLRLRLDFETPTVYAALNNIRSRFIDSACPLLTREMITLAASMTDADLDNKGQFKRVVTAMYPEVPFARGRVILHRDEAVRLAPVRDVLREHLADTAAADMLGQRAVGAAREFFDGQTNGVDNNGTLVRRLQTAGTDLSRRLKARFVHRVDLEIREIAMRSYLARLQMEEMHRAAGFAHNVMPFTRRATA
jgi:hypothetical protein